MFDKKTLIRRLLYSGYFVAAFLLFLLLLFPFDRVKSRLESEIRQRTPLEVSIGRISPRFFHSFALSDVVVSSKTGTVLFEAPSVNTSISLFSLIRGLVSLNLASAPYGGELHLKTRQGKGSQYLLVDADSLDIGSYSYLKNAGYRFAGKLGGNFEMNGDSGKGRIWIKGLTSRELKVMGLPVPDLDFDQCWLETEVKGDRLTIKKLELEGKEVKLRATGDIVLRQQGTLNLVVKLKLSERMAREQAWIAGMLKNKDSEGYMMLTLGGTLAQPVPRF